MPNCDFYAVPDDWLEVVRFIFSNEGWILYELSSEFDCEVRAFTSVDDVRALLRSGKGSYHFQLYSPEMGGSVRFERITLNPGAAPGKSFRHATRGWGLIQFYVEEPRDRKLRASHTNHFSEAGAGKWAPLSPEAGPVDKWNWRRVTSMSRRLNRYIHSMAVAKSGSRPILASAQEALVAKRISRG